MAVYKLFPSKDTTLYSYYNDMNTGMDPIIEISNLNKDYDPIPQVARFLIQFNQSEIDNIINEKIGNSNFNSVLKCYIAKAEGLVNQTTLEVFAVAEEWNNGSGTYLDTPIVSNGASWSWRTFEDDSRWKAINFDVYTTASWSGSLSGGGVWYTGSNDPNNTNLTPTQSFDLRTIKDINVNVTDIVKVWYSSSNSIGAYTNIDNNGFILKFEDSVEFNSNDNVQPILKFFSVDTNTIYPPCLELRWDDSSFNTGSLNPILTSDLYIGLDNNPGVFYKDSINRFRLNVREEYPVRTFSTSSLYTVNRYLNNNSLYAVKDLDTNEFVIDFDSNYTKISCDSKGNYFDLYMNGLEPERYYKILIKTTIDGTTVIKDNNYYFKIING